MFAELSLSADDLKIIGHALTWVLNMPSERTPSPGLSTKQRQEIRILVNELLAQQRACEFGPSVISLKIGDSFFCEDWQMQVTLEYFSLIVASLAAFYLELQHSPTELEVVTGLPVAKITALSTELQRTLDDARSNVCPVLPNNNI